MLRVEGRFTEALSSCRRALELDPRLLPALAFMGELLADQGEFDQARQMFERVMALDPNSAAAWAGICGLRRMTRADTQWLAGAQRSVSQNLTPQAEAQLRYALGKYFDDVGDYPAAFAEYHRANEVAKRYTPKYDRLELTRAIDATLQRYDRDWLTRSRCDTNTSAATHLCGWYAALGHHARRADSGLASCGTQCGRIAVLDKCDRSIRSGGIQGAVRLRARST